MGESSSQSSTAPNFSAGRSPGGGTRCTRSRSTAQAARGYTWPGLQQIWLPAVANDNDRNPHEWGLTLTLDLKRRRYMCEHTCARMCACVRMSYAWHANLRVLFFVSASLDPVATHHAGARRPGPVRWASNGRGAVFSWRPGRVMATNKKQRENRRRASAMCPHAPGGCAQEEASGKCRLLCVPGGAKSQPEVLTDRVIKRAVEKRARQDSDSPFLTTPSIAETMDEKGPGPAAV